MKQPWTTVLAAAAMAGCGQRFRADALNEEDLPERATGKEGIRMQAKTRSWQRGR